jgi:cytochrome c2
MKTMALMAAALLLTSCEGRNGAVTAAAMTGGDHRLGRTALREYGCGACHAIPGVTGARGLVGPPLTGIGSRSYIAGVLPNSPENMIRWILDPPGVNPMTAMPDVGVSERTARDMAAYLYTLR